MPLGPTRHLLPAALFAMSVALVTGRCQQAQGPPATAADARFQNGVDLLREHKYAEAEQAFRDAYRLDPSNLSALRGMIQVKVSQNQIDDAIRLVQEEVNKNPTRIALRLELGKVTLMAGRVDQAIEVLRPLTVEANLDSVPADVFLVLGEAYRHKGDYESAAASLRRAVELSPHNAQAVLNLASALERSGKKEEAMKQYRAALQLTPDSAFAMNNLAYLLSETDGGLEEALTMARHAHTLLPELPEAADTLGWIYVKLDRAAEGLPILQELVRNQPADPEYRFHLGKALLATGDRLGAIQQLQKALECNPPADLASKIRAALQ